MSSCPWEARSAQAARTGFWPEEVAEHRKQCLECQEVALVTAFMAEELQEEMAPAPLPDPRMLWLRAQLELRQEKARRAEAPITGVQWAAGAVAVAAAWAFIPAGDLWNKLLSNWTAVFKPDVSSGFDWLSVGAPVVSCLVLAAFVVVALLGEKSELTAHRHLG